MQIFIVTVRVATNAADEVSPEDVRQAVSDLLEDYDGGPMPEVVSVVEE